MNRVLQRRPLTRAAILRSLGALALMQPLTILCARAAQPALTPAETEGPFFVDGQIERSDLRTDPRDGSHLPGVPLQLVFGVHRLTARGAAPLAGAHVDLWHADAGGAYSQVSAGTPTSGYLRGYQRTDDAGVARFLTIFPGWYAGRSVHIHFKVRTQTDRAEPYEFTSQLYFDDALTDIVYRSEPYVSRGVRPVRNRTDGIFDAPLAANDSRPNGTALLLPLVGQADGYAGRFDVALDLDRPAVETGPPHRRRPPGDRLGPLPDGSGPPPGGPGGPPGRAPRT